MADFIEPASLEEAERRKLEALEKLHKINADLQMRAGARDGQGNFARPAGEFFAWKRKATFAKVATEHEVRALNQWMRAERQALAIRRAQTALKEDSATTLLRQAHAMLKRTCALGFEPDAKEQALMDRIRNFLVGNETLGQLNPPNVGGKPTV